MATAADCTHPTEMHSCFENIFLIKLSLKIPLIIYNISLQTYLSNEVCKHVNNSLNISADICWNHQTSVIWVITLYVLCLVAPTRGTRLTRKFLERNAPASSPWVLEHLYWLYPYNFSGFLNNEQTSEWLWTIYDVVTGRARLIRIRLIRSSNSFEVSVKCFPIIFQSFHV